MALGSTWEENLKYKWLVIPEIKLRSFFFTSAFLFCYWYSQIFLNMTHFRGFISYLCIIQYSPDYPTFIYPTFRFIQHSHTKYNRHLLEKKRREKHTNFQKPNSYHCTSLMKDPEECTAEIRKFLRPDFQEISIFSNISVI